MVRLKVRVQEWLEKNARWFQFLMVRLKDVARRISNFFNFRFNSLWCD